MRFPDVQAGHGPPEPTDAAGLGMVFRPAPDVALGGRAAQFASGRDPLGIGSRQIDRTERRVVPPAHHGARRDRAGPRSSGGKLRRQDVRRPRKWSGSGDGRSPPRARAAARGGGPPRAGRRCWTPSTTRAPPRPARRCGRRRPRRRPSGSPREGGRSSRRTRPARASRAPPQPGGRASRSSAGDRPIRPDRNSRARHSRSSPGAARPLRSAPCPAAARAPARSARSRGRAAPPR